MAYSSAKVEERVEQARRGGWVELSLFYCAATDDDLAMLFRDEPLERLTFLDLSSNRFSAIPAGVARLTRLETLALADNPLASLPPEMFGLANLVRLNLATTGLTALPPEIGRLTALV